MAGRSGGSRFTTGYSGSGGYSGGYGGFTSHTGGYGSSSYGHSHGYGSGGYGSSSGGYHGYVGGGHSSYSGTSQSSMLQNVIRNLVDSTDDEERMQQKARLEDDLSVAWERLETLVREHKDKLHSTLDTFEKIDQRVRDSQEKIHALKKNMQSSKTLLKCKRDELKRLWLEDVRFKHMLKLIDTVEQVKAVPEQLKQYRASKHFLHATELVNNMVSRLEGELAAIEALRDLRQELGQQKERLHEEMIDELHRHLYVKATARKATLREQAALAAPSDSQATSPPLPRRQTAASKHSRTASRAMAMEKEGHPFSPPPTIMEDESEVIEDLHGDPEENSSHYMAVLIEALSILGKVEETLDAIGSRMRREFVLIVERASVRVTRQAEQEAGPLSRRTLHDNNPKLLRKLLSLCFAKFHSVVQAHAVLLSHLHRAKKVFNGSYQIYEEIDVWAAIQHVLETTLEQYISGEDETIRQGGGGGGGGYTALQGASDVHAMFASKRRTGRKGQGVHSFRFDSSRHAISINSYMKEQRDLELAEGVERETTRVAMDQHAVVQHLVCKPSKRNITVIFGPVREFIKEMEVAMCLHRKNCTLHHFIHDFVKYHFLDSLTVDCNRRLSNATKPEVARTTASDQKTSKIVGSKQQVLNSMVVMWQLVEDMRQLMRNLSLYSPQFLQITINLLERYRDSCSNMYRELTGSGEGGGKAGASGSVDYVVSSKWARDPDINLKIRLLPSWLKLYQSTPNPSDDETKQVLQESELLMSNLGTEPLRKTNVLLDHDTVRLLGILQESLDWFSSHLKQLVMELGRSGAGVLSTDGASMSTISSDEEVNEPERAPLDLTEQLSKIQFDFQSLSETTVITLHLEVRSHCFYYLQPALHKPHYVFEPVDVGEDQQVKQLAFDLRNIETVMSAVLTPEKLRYLFDGLGHLVASIFIGSTEHMRKINTNGVKKMCRNISVLQSCLSKITLIREKDLDRARRYYEMLYLNDEEILHQMYEQGAQFSLRDYKNAFRVLAHSQPSYDSDRLTARTQAVETYFSKDSV